MKSKYYKSFYMKTNISKGGPVYKKLIKKYDTDSEQIL